MINTQYEGFKQVETQSGFLLYTKDDTSVAIVKNADTGLYESFNVEAFTQWIEKISETHKLICLDLRNIKAISSSALGVIVRLNQTLMNSNGKLVLLFTTDGMVKDILDITKLKSIFTYTHSFEDAIKELETVCPK